MFTKIVINQFNIKFSQKSTVGLDYLTAEVLLKQNLGLKKWILFLLIFFIQTAKSQPIFLKIKTQTDDVSISNSIIKKQNLKTFYLDSASAFRDLNKLVTAFYQNGYLTATIDSTSKKDSALNVVLLTGKKYEWSKIIFRKSDMLLIDEAGVHSKMLEGKIVSPSQLTNVTNQVLHYCENNGYPFARISFKNILLNDNLFSAEMQLEKNQLVKIDSIVIVGNSKLSTAFLFNYINIKPGDLYNENDIRKITTRLRELPFVAETKSPVIKFFNDNCWLTLYLDNKKSNQIDGIIGILPGNEKGSKTQITGEARIKLQNAFSHGESFDLNWKQPAAKTQDLKIKLTYPFLFKSPFGIDAGLNVYKKDTSYLDVNRLLGINYFLPGGDFLKLYVLYQTSSLLNTKGLENITTLPTYADIKKTQFGLGTRQERLDYRFNPTSGYSVEFNFIVGKKVIKENSEINPVVYDSLDLNSTNYNGDLIANYYYRLAPRHVLNLMGMGAYVYNVNLFSNELYRIGGLRTLRGFDEESILASQFAIGRLEYRYILDLNSYLFLFYNMAYYENRSGGSFVHDTPYGFGAGLTFETKLGIFAFSYALGKQFDNPIYIRAAKIHFGIINYF